MAAYYNEIDAYAAQWLRNLIDNNLIAKGDVDERSIRDVAPEDLRGYTQCHFFAGIGGWAYAARLAGWPDERPLWTGSAPCQPFSVAGKGKAQEDERHLWPVFFELIRACRPSVLMGEQVAAAVGKDWLDGVCADLEGVGYACGATVVPACAVDAPHRRDRLWFVADAGQVGRDGWGAPARREAGTNAWVEGRRSRDVADAACIGRKEWEWQNREQVAGGSRQSRMDAFGNYTGGPLADAERQQPQGGVHELRSDPSAEGRGAATEFAGLRALDCHVADSVRLGRQGSRTVGRPRDPAQGFNGQASDVVDAGAGFWSNHRWAIGADGKARRVEPSIRLLAHGVPARVGRLRAYGNAIVPALGAEIIRAYLETEGRQ